MISVRRVHGKSMEPTLRSGQIIIVSHFHRPRVGDVVMAYQKGREVVKRIAAQTEQGSYMLEGDNSAHSTDSRQHGPVPIRHIEGIVIWPRHIYKSARRRKKT